MIDVLPDGRLLLDYGPVSMLITSSKNGIMQSTIGPKCHQVVENCLQDIHRDLPVLTQKSPAVDPRLLTPCGAAMLESIFCTDMADLTPMAAVAGTIADCVADTFATDSDQVIVNNGGDIALRLAPGQNVTLDISAALSAASPFQSCRIAAEDAIGGIATSGLGGRSFTKGIADSVTVFADCCRTADAIATYLANSTHIESPNVLSIRAELLDPDSDIAGDLITFQVNDLSEAEIQTATDQLLYRCQILSQKQSFKMIACIQSHYICFPDVLT
ncbi:hypothetical protein [Hespellia stercorisuis]|uniref:FAD:protein FMN transferase n=1 Tax=Hespellia stercorisuis DSM 15480 TaxID=1121950 RepID=A0A1M6SMB8_9FIRM|nr:hypothetical protein [Hespellia stercorisuis]SHK45759.1 hypothetical protein SAMN02745243_02987 [Hespellia stercorisuis DSM 15480]